MSTPKRILVIDIEATCWENAPPNKTAPEKRRNEIIEIGITPIRMDKSTTDGRIIPVLEASEAIIVRPTTTEISEFCTKLTTLTPEFVAQNGVSFVAAISYLDQKYRPDVNIWASYGDYDRQAFDRQCRNEGVQYPFTNNHINVKALFASRYGVHAGMDKALKLLNIPLEGTHHRGVDDSRNIAKILLAL